MASSSRGNQEKYSTGSELNSARSKLDGVLQTLMDRTDDSLEGSDDDDQKIIPEIIINESTQPVSPKKTPGIKTPRKRRRKDDGIRDVGQNHYSYVTKLFDRSVDLAQFSEDTPLYPVCRAWMYNEPYNTNLRQSKTSPSTSDTEAMPVPEVDDKEENKGNIYKLQPPHPMPRNEDSSIRDLRIPPAMPPSTSDKLDINADAEKAPTRETLLSNHMIRWKAIRQSWKRASLANEARYKESLAVIKAEMIT